MQATPLNHLFDGERSVLHEGPSLDEEDEDMETPNGLEPNVFVGRQPILDRRGQLVAYELLFRASAQAQSAVFADQAVACTRVLVSTFMSMGIDAVLGPHRGFINVTELVLESGLVEALPPERVVLEILENVRPTPEVIAQCIELRKAGYSLALDDYVPDDPRAELLDIADIVKVDLPSAKGEQLAVLVETLRSRDVTLLAEKVEERSEFRLCHDLGFDLFQGYYFARPEIVEGKSLDPTRAVLIDLMNRLRQDVESNEIADVFKQNANLGVSLLRLVNCAAVARPQPISNVRDAVNYLGRSHLYRWIGILLFADVDGQGGPLLQTAARRGRLMELVAGQTGESARQRDAAFLVGMLSLVDALLGRNLADVVPELNIESELRDALLDQSGCLGRLLVLVRHLESMQLEPLEALTAALGMDIPQLQALEQEAFEWVNDMLETGL